MSESARKRNRADGRPEWRLLTNHGAALLFLAFRPNDTVRSAAAALNLTERTMAAIIADLRATGYLEVQRRGRRNTYTINYDLPAPRTAFRGLTVGSFLRSLKITLQPPPRRPATRRRLSAGTSQPVGEFRQRRSSERRDLSGPPERSGPRTC